MKADTEEIDTEEINKALDEFEQQKANLPASESYPQPDILNMRLEEIRKRDASTLAEDSFELRRYLFSIRRLSNRLSAWKKWAYSKLDEITAANLTNIEGNYGWNERVIIAKNYGKEAIRINKFIRKISMELDSLNEVPECIELIAKSVESIKFSHMKEDRHG